MAKLQGIPFAFGISLNPKGILHVRHEVYERRRQRIATLGCGAFQNAGSADAPQPT